MAGYWPSSQKTEQGQYPAILTEQAWSTKDLLFGFQRNIRLLPFLLSTYMYLCVLMKMVKH